MPSIDLLVSSELTRTPRVMQLESMFDVPAQQKLAHRWQGDLPIEHRDWNVGLIVGPSGCGKTSIASALFETAAPFEWSSASVIDDFAAGLSIQDISAVCSSVGFNTIPSWMKPFGVLSTGEKFRVEIARAMLERQDPIVIDEFTSVVDRQVAHFGCVAVSKLIRSRKRKFVAVTCHHDVVDWLQPDWVLEPASMSFHWRALQRRPELHVEIARVDYKAWEVFAPFHYLTNDLAKAAVCFVLFVDGMPAAFAGVLHFPHARTISIKRVSRLVTLPDYQGMGLAMVLVERLGQAYRACGYRLRTYPAHPSLVRSFDRSSSWELLKKPGTFNTVTGRKSMTTKGKSTISMGHDDRPAFGGRPCAVFEYAGAAATDVATARALIAGD